MRISDLMSQISLASVLYSPTYPESPVNYSKHPRISSILYSTVFLMCFRLPTNSLSTFERVESFSVRQESWSTLEPIGRGLRLRMGKRSKMLSWPPMDGSFLFGIEITFFVSSQCAAFGTDLPLIFAPVTTDLLELLGEI